ncbi:hypothetical protein [Gilvibacter sp.]|uniref:hypothetical protein n=1 Tax=Gilvibacter sp. TaxID=2729997 RepID=UPI0025BDA96B|nr:hypothetical protein [Gilvibacter sp.]NQX77260.1 hypothetical protein [Gilvibacter sp.]
MNRELFDNAKALVESRKIEAVEVALQTVYGQGTDAQKAEIEEMAVVLMMVNRDKGCIKWAKSRLESTQFVNSTVVIHSIASLLLKTSQQSLKCSLERMKDLCGMWDAMSRCELPEMIDLVLEGIMIQRIVCYYELVITQTKGSWNWSFKPHLNTPLGKVVIIDKVGWIDDDIDVGSIAFLCREVLDHMPSYVKTEEGYTLKVEPRQQCIAYVCFLDGSQLEVSC